MDDIRNLVKSTIPLMGMTFDTHELILTLAQRHQRAYIRALDQVQGETPFQTLHSMIGKMIKELSPEFHLVGKASSSKDIFGNDNSCVRWSRTQP